MLARNGGCCAQTEPFEGVEPLEPVFGALAQPLQQSFQKRGAGIEREALCLIAAGEAGQGGLGQLEAAQQDRPGKPGRDAGVVAAPDVDKVECAHQDRGLGPARRQLEAERQVLAPVAALGFCEACAPGRQGTERVAGRGDPPPARQVEAPLRRKNIDFIDLDALQLERAGIAGPGGTQSPCRCHQTCANPGIEAGDRGHGISERTGEVGGPGKRTERQGRAGHGQIVS